MPERYQEALDQPVTIEFDEVPLRDVFEYLRDSYDALNFVFEEGIADLPVTLHLVETPLGQALQALSELHGGELCFVVRDYGILITDISHVRLMPGPTIPAYVPYAGPPVRQTPPARPGTR